MISIATIVSFLGGFWGKALGVAAAVAFVWGLGYKTADDSWKAYNHKQEVIFLQKAEDADKKDTVAAADAAKVKTAHVKRAKENSNALTDPNAVVFAGPDAQRLRDLWNK